MKSTYLFCIQIPADRSGRNLKTKVRPAVGCDPRNQAKPIAEESAVDSTAILGGFSEDLVDVDGIYVIYVTIVCLFHLRFLL